MTADGTLNAMNSNEPAVSVVVPVRNEAGNIAPLVAEIAAALDGQWPFEVVYVDDGSSDGTAAELARLMAQHSWLRRVRHTQSCGQSAAVRSGVKAARAPLIVTLDGDGQNNPAFIPALLRALEQGASACRTGRRPARRAQGERLQETAIAHRQCRARRGAARRHARHRLRARRRSAATCSWRCPISTGCIVFCRRLVKRDGYDIGYADVVDRPRGSGVSNYGLWDRLWVGILDLAGVWWLIRRKKRNPEVSEE